LPRPFDFSRYRYAALALTVPDRAKDHFASVVARNRVTIEQAAQLAATLIAQKVRTAAPTGA
jgi:hypothetical protein